MSEDSGTWDLRGRHVVVTGGAGFVGSHICEALVEAGAHVTAVDNLSSGSSHNLDRVADRVRLEVTALEAHDIHLLEGADLIIHTAANAYVPPSVDAPLYDFDVNLLLTLRLLEWCRAKAPATRVILFSTAAVYGDTPRPAVEDSTPLDPISPYGVSKLAAERYGAVYSRLYGMPVTTLRCFPIYGPRQRKQVVYDVMTRMSSGGGRLTVLGDGTQRRSLCFVEDIARATTTLAHSAPFQGEAYNAGGVEPVSVAELVDMVAATLGLDPEVTFTGDVRRGDPQALISDSTKLGKLGWHPEVSMRDGLLRTWNWLSSESTIAVT